MRFLVEVTSIGKTEKESFCVEADSWQRALQATRALRDDNGPMSGFSIELLEEGCRAVDPMLRLRYEVKPAPPGMALSERASGAPATPAMPVAPATAPEHANANANANAKKNAVGKTTAMMGSSGALVANVPQEAKPAAPPAPPSPAAPSLVSSQVIFKREQEATTATPIAYREYVYAVAQGTTESAAEQLVQAQLEQVKASLAAVDTRKLVHLAVFDVMFQPGKGKPPVLPLVTLAWRDWRDGARVVFPRRSSASMRAAKPAADPLARSSPASSSAPPIVALAPPIAAAHRPEPPRAAPQPSKPAAPQPQAPPVVVVAHSAPPPKPEPPPAAPPGPVAVLRADTLPTIETEIASTVPSAHAPFAEATVQSPVAPAAGPLAPSPHFPGAPVPAAAATRNPASSGALRAATTTTRRRGDELIADLFEAMHDLHFVQDSVAGGDFCVALALEKMPSAAGIVHLYDINKREFVIAATRGEGTRALLLLRHSEADPLLNAAMRRRRAFVVENPSTGEAAMLERFTKLGGAKSLMIAPVMLSGRFLGAIELVNPLDGAPYTNEEVNALQYIAEQLAEYVAASGVVIDPERISMPPPAHAPTPPRRAR